MPPYSPPPPFAALVLLVSLASTAATSACSPAKPAEAPEGAAPKEDSDSPPSPAQTAHTGGAADTDAPAKEPSGSADKPSDVDKSMSMDTYEMTPSDCDALGRQYGEVSRSDQMSALSAKLSEKQRAATAAQVDKVVSKLQEAWMNQCQTALVNKAVDHDSIKCALAAKTVKAFDVCLNGTSGPATAPGNTTKKTKK